jgi:hypothetical protein
LKADQGKSYGSIARLQLKRLMAQVSSLQYRCLGARSELAATRYTKLDLGGFGAPNRMTSACLKRTGSVQSQQLKLSDVMGGLQTFSAGA